MKNKLAASALKSASIYIAVLVVVIVAAELFSPFKNFLAGLTGHHWTAKGVLGVILFILLTFLFNLKGSDDDLNKNITKTISTAVTGIVVLFLFYIIHYFI